MNEAEKRKRRRFDFMRALYDRTGDNVSSRLHVEWIASDINVDRDSARRIAQYLHAEGLILLARDGTLFITHQGIVEIEQALSRPEEPTQHFPPTNIVHIHGNVANSVIQQASPGATVSLNKETVDGLLEFLRRLEEELGQIGLAPGQYAAVIADIHSAKSQLDGPTPKSSVVTECLHSIRSILEGTASSVLASSLLQQMARLMQ